MLKVNLNILIVVCVFIMAITEPVVARTIYVDPNGSADFTSIQAAINDPCTVDGDEIEVGPGTYYEAINFNGRAVRLYSSGGPEVTTIDATGLDSSVVTCISGEDANPILEGFTITGGNANRGGGMYNDGSSPTVTNCNFSGNSAAEGGGMGNENNSNPIVTNCTFTNNSADAEGGGMHNDSSSSPTVTNCTFTNNSAFWDGGGMYNVLFSSPTVTNCNFTGNTATEYGGGMYNYDSSPTVTNCILWDNMPDEIYSSSTSTTTVSFSDVQGGYTGTGNIDADPLFLNAPGGDLRLRSSSSPCVDAGDNSAPALPATDLAGNPRVIDGDVDGTAVVDMGAFELQPGQIHNITQDLWYEYIQVSIDDANDGDHIEVAPGMYTESIDFKGKAVRLYSSDGPELTAINGNGAYHVVQCVTGEDANTILEGFTITGGNASGTSSPSWDGGGMLNDGSSPTVTNCNFRGNTASFGGGGMGNQNNSSPTVKNCMFSGNIATYGGGGMGNQNNSSPIVTNCNFRGNTAGYGGGGMGNQNNSSPIVTNCTFSGNTAYGGGGMVNDGGSPTVTNCTFSMNTATERGGGMYNYSSSPTVTNCTFSGNSALEGGGIFNYESSPTVTNCILWNDTPDEIYNDAPSTPTVTYSDIQDGGYPDANNINADPCFIDANSGDLRLKPDSPCIDAGNNNAVPSSITTDLSGLPRFIDSCRADTGSGIPPIVDMGAYEAQPPWTTHQNLLVNPGFETGDATGWITNWGWNLTATAQQVHSGSYSGLASGRTESWQGAWRSVLGLMDDGKTYRISGWVRLDTADSNHVALTVKKVDSTGDHYYGIDNATAYSDKWVNLDGTLNFDANESMTDLYIYFEGPAPDVNFYVDDASVTEVMGDMNHNGGVDFIDFGLFASYYGFDCSTQDCGRANLYDCDNAINERDLAILVRDWLVGAEP